MWDVVHMGCPTRARDPRRLGGEGRPPYPLPVGTRREKILKPPPILVP